MEIPRNIHQIWLGPKPKLERFMASWVSFCDRFSFDYHFWSEDEINELDFENKPIYQMCLERKNWHGASDIARVAILNKIGGFYLDCDFLWGYNDEASHLLSAIGTFFATTEHHFPPPHILNATVFPEDLSNVERAVFLCNGFLGSVPSHPILCLHEHYQRFMVEQNGGKVTAETAGCYFLTWCSQYYPFTLIPAKWIFPAQLHSPRISLYVNEHSLNSTIQYMNQDEAERVWKESRRIEDRKSNCLPNP